MCCVLSQPEIHTPSPGASALVTNASSVSYCGTVPWEQRSEGGKRRHWPLTAGDLGWPTDVLHHGGGFQFLLWTRAYLKPVVNSGLRASLWSSGGPMQSEHRSVGCSAEPMRSCQHRQCLCAVWIARLGTSSVLLTLSLDLTFIITRKCNLDLTDQSLLLLTNLTFRY